MDFSMVVNWGIRSCQAWSTMRSAWEAKTKSPVFTSSCPGQDVYKRQLKGYYNYTPFYLNGESNDTATSRQRNILYGVRGRETLNLWKGSEIVVGFDLDVSDLQNKQDKFAPGATDTTWDFPSHTMFSPYLGISQTFGRDDGFHITPSTGLRLYTSNLWQDYVSPQAGLVLGYDHTNLAFSYARGVNYRCV